MAQTIQDTFNYFTTGDNAITKYSEGSDRNNKNTADCSSFVQRFFKKAFNVDPGSNTTEIMKNGQYISTNYNDLQVGDVEILKKGKDQHARIYCGIDADGNRIWCEQSTTLGRPKMRTEQHSVQGMTSKGIYRFNIG